jgi:hypothetical protein
MALPMTIISGSDSSKPRAAIATFKRRQRFWWCRHVRELNNGAGSPAPVDAEREDECWIAFYCSLGRVGALVAIRVSKKLVAVTA